jgi:hypothetical protein
MEANEGKVVSGGTTLRGSRSADSDVEVGGEGTHMQREDLISLRIFLLMKESCLKRCAVRGLLGLLFVLFNAALSVTAD